MEKPCPLCGEQHEPIQGGAVFPVIHTCERIPEGFVYIDDEFATGPKGRLLRLGEKRYVRAKIDFGPEYFEPR